MTRLIVDDQRSIIVPPSIKHFRDSVEERMFAVFQEFSKYFEATYLSYIFENPELSHRIVYCSDKNWQKHFVDEGWINHCNIIKEGSRRFDIPWCNSHILLWDSVETHTKLQKEVVGIRKEFGYGNGISFCQKVNGYKEGVGLAADVKNIRFPFLLSQNMHIIKKFVFELRKIAIQHLPPIKIIKPH